MVSLLETITQWGKTRPNDVALTFISDDGTHHPLTYGDLYNKARQYAYSLRESIKEGDRCLICMQPSQQYVIAFIGTLYAGCIPIPAYPPISAQHSGLLAQFAEAAQCQFMVVDKSVHRVAKVLKLVSPLVGPSVLNKMNKLTPLHLTKALLSCRVTFFDKLIRTNKKEECYRDQSSTAYIQFSSGTTDRPKGVMVTYNNLSSNLDMIHAKFKARADSQGYIWIPPFHDMGLIGGILYPLKQGFHVYLTSPLRFIRNPARWMNEASELKATITGGPNFAYSLCAALPDRRLSSNLDLSSVDVFFCGSEQVIPDDIKKFYQRYERFNLSPSTFLPCYGLAESTLMVTAECNTIDEHTYLFRSDALLNNKLRAAKKEEEASQLLCSCGDGYDEQEVVIVNPETFEEVPDGDIGLVLLKSQSVTKGYYHRPALTQKIFHAKIKNKKDDYLNTGDLGGFFNGLLFISGRLKDVFIINGKNYYSSLLEDKLAKRFPEVRRGSVAVVQCHLLSSNKPIVLAELGTQGDMRFYREVTQKIRDYFYQECQITLLAVGLLKKRSIPKTTSGKVSRARCVDSIHKMNFDYVYLDDPSQKLSNRGEKASIIRSIVPPNFNDMTQKQKMHFIRKHVVLSSKKVTKKWRIPSAFSFSNELSSLEIISLCMELNLLLDSNKTLEPSDVYTYSTVSEMTVYLYEMMQGRGMQEFDSSCNTDNRGCLDIKKLISTSRPASDTVETVLLTGATGFLGCYLIEALLKNTAWNIVCLVRGESKQAAEARLKLALEKQKLNLADILDRVSVVVGDMSMSELGIDEVSYRQLSTTIDCVINAAAEINFLQNEKQLKGKDLAAIDHVARFCVVGKLKSLEHISTYSVLLGRNKQLPLEEVAYNERPGIGLGYSVSKWEVEKRLLAMKEQGLPVNIFRLGNLTGSSKTGIFNAADMLSSIFMSSMQLGSFFNKEMQFDITPVDYAARAVVGLIKLADHGHFYHITNPEKVSLSSIVHFFEASGLAVKKIVYHQWIQDLVNLVKSTASPGKRAVPMLFSDYKNKQYRFISSFDVGGITICQKDTMAKLKQLGILFPVVDQTLLSLYLTNFKQHLQDVYEFTLK